MSTPQPLLPPGVLEAYEFGSAADPRARKHVVRNGVWIGQIPECTHGRAVGHAVLRLHQVDERARRVM
jgi:hypothetical protein